MSDVLRVDSGTIDVNRKPSAGVIPPRSASRIEFTPPLTDDEKPMLLTVTGTGTIDMKTTPETVILANLTDKHAPFLLMIVPQNPSLGAIFDFIRQRLGG